MPNDINKLKRLMFAANYLRKNDPVILRGNRLNQSGALKFAWWFEDFRKKLRTGVYRFSYFKTDGSIREATGTLNVMLMPDDQMPKGVGTPAIGTVPYFDLEKQEWRSFRLDNFIGFVQQV